MIHHFEQRPARVAAVQFTGDNADEIHAFVGADFFSHYGDTVFVYSHEIGSNRALAVGDWVLRDTRSTVLRILSTQELRGGYAPVSVPPATVADYSHHIDAMERS